MAVAFFLLDVGAVCLDSLRAEMQILNDLTRCQVFAEFLQKLRVRGLKGHRRVNPCLHQWR